MEYFAREFMKSKGQPIEYKGKTLVLMDYFSIPSRMESLQYRIMSTNSEWKQGISLSTKGSIIYKDNVIKRGWADIWTHLMPWEDQFICKSREGILRVKNVWDTGNGTVESWINGAAMWVEAVPNGRRYHCNDGHFDDDFDELVFEIVLAKDH